MLKAGEPPEQVHTGYSESSSSVFTGPAATKTHTGVNDGRQAAALLL